VPTVPLFLQDHPPNCSLPSIHPGRAFVALAVRTSADYSSARGHQKALLTHALFQQTLLNVLRRDAGAVFSIESQPFLSQVFDRFGYVQVLRRLPILITAELEWKSLLFVAVERGRTCITCQLILMCNRAGL